jgi:hypothetical protein
MAIKQNQISKIFSLFTSKKGNIIYKKQFQK